MTAAADGAAPPSPARLDGGGVMAAMAAAADVSQVQACMKMVKLLA